MRYGLQLLGGENRFVISRARQELGFSPRTGFTEGVRNSVELVPRRLPGARPSRRCRHEHDPHHRRQRLRGQAPRLGVCRTGATESASSRLPGEDASWLEQRGVAVYHGDVRRPESLAPAVQRRATRCCTWPP